MVWYPRGVGYPGEVGYPGGRIYPPTPQKKYGTRDTLPPEKIWDKGPGGDLAPEILYPPWTDKHLCKQHYLPATSLAASKYTILNDWCHHMIQLKRQYR